MRWRCYIVNRSMFFPTFLRWESWPGFWGCPYDQDGFQRVRYCYNATTRQMPSKPRCLMSLPGAKEQLWHVDGEHLYTSEPNLACYGSTQQVREYLHNCWHYPHIQLNSVTIWSKIGRHNTDDKKQLRVISWNIHYPISKYKPAKIWENVSISR